MAEKEEAIVLDGIVTEALRGKFRVKIPNEDAEKPSLFVVAHLAGKMRKNYIKIVTGDKVKVEISPYDIEKGRIIYRSK